MEDMSLPPYWIIAVERFPNIAPYLLVCTLSQVDSRTQTPIDPFVFLTEARWDTEDVSLPPFWNWATSGYSNSGCYQAEL